MKTLAGNVGVVVLFLFITVSGCRKFEDIVVHVDGVKVSFTLPASELGSDKHYILYDVAVTDEQCQQDCVFWEMVRQSEPTPPLEKYFINFPITYGQPLANMQVRKHKPVKPGQYSVVATIGIVSNSKVVDSKSIHKKFTIK